jgi:hypothetical protein
MQNIHTRYALNCLILNVGGIFHLGSLILNKVILTIEKLANLDHLEFIWIIVMEFSLNI